MDFLTAPRSWSRYVALGDSLTAGRGDSGPDGRPVGWARRLAGLLTDRTGVNCALTNLAVDGATIGRVLADQLPHLGDVGADLVSATVGMNDIRNPQFSPGVFAADVGRLLDALARTGATLLTCTLPDIADVVPLPPEHVSIARFRLAQASDIIREQAAVRGAVCLDAWAMKDMTSRPDLFTADRLHPNARGHRMLAAVFADLLLPAQSAA
ncbi:MAG TPA: SGNH/GDSL hydrolase family protein [Streptosporangiaceae bacterium]|nr:SGNH/GDSL hydrolase family protein [Streptosporangiaceae bacterium]